MRMQTSVRFAALAALIAVFVTGCAGTRNVSDRDINTIDLETLIGLIERQENNPGKRKLLLLDSRAEPKFNAGHIPGARHMLTSGINPALGRDPSIEAYDEIVVYADHPGSASSKALVKLMMSLRYDDVRLFPGGLESWKRAGLRVAGVD